MDWELVDLSVFFMMELSELLLTGGLLLLLLLLLLLSWSCLGTLGGLALAAGCLTGETDLFLLLRRREERGEMLDARCEMMTILLAGSGLGLAGC